MYSAGAGGEQALQPLQPGAAGDGPFGDRFASNHGWGGEVPVQVGVQSGGQFLGAAFGFDPYSAK